MVLESHPFWRFSLRTYRRPGVEPACLALQNRYGADVNLVLFCCWAAASGRGALGTRAIRAAMSSTARWQAGVIQPLRAARASLKTGFEGVAPARALALRRAIGRIELDCEHAEQLLLARQLEALPRTGFAEPARAARTGIARYFTCLGARPDSAARNAIIIIIEAALET